MSGPKRRQRKNRCWWLLSFQILMRWDLNDPGNQVLSRGGIWSHIDIIRMDIGCYRLHDWSKLVQSRGQRTSSSSDSPSFKVRNSTKTLGAEIWQQAVLGLNGFCGHAMLQAPDLGMGWSSTMFFPLSQSQPSCLKQLVVFWNGNEGWGAGEIGRSSGWVHRPFLHADSEKWSTGRFSWLGGACRAGIKLRNLCQSHLSVAYAA